MAPVVAGVGDPGVAEGGDGEGADGEGVGEVDGDLDVVGDLVGPVGDPGGEGVVGEVGWCLVGGEWDGCRPGVAGWGGGHCGGGWCFGECSGEC